ncbi:Tab2/Atab2 family RNA-binding protein, partial [Acaryochloris sp. IP29b_bin.148]
MTIWQVDFDRRPLKNTEDYPLWELTVYDPQT